MTNSSDLLSSILRTDFAAFAARSLVELENKTPRAGPHVEAICRALTAVHQGKIKRLVINQPPRTLKSFLGTIAFSAWKLGHDPSLKIIIACHDVRLAETHADKIRRLLRSDMFAAAFPRTRLRADFSGRDQFQTDQGGGVLAISMGSGVTGHGADLIIIDDPLDAGKANSATERQLVIDLVETKLMSRLNSQANGVVLVLQQRLHEDDLSGHIKRHGRFCHLVVPLVAEKDGGVKIDNWTWRRPAGDVLDPEEYPPSVIENLSRNPVVFAAQYQQSPRPEGEALVPADCFGSYDSIPPAAQRIVLSFDTAVKSTGASYSVCLVFKTDGENHYLIDVWRDRVDYGFLEIKAIELFNRYKPALVIVEDAGLGSAVKNALTKANGPENADRVLMVKAIRSKIDRLQGVLDVLNARRVHLPSYAPFREAFLREVCAFPGSTTDDQVDALSQYLTTMREVGPTWLTPKILARGPAMRPRNPMRDPANIHPNFVPRGRLPSRR